MEMHDALPRISVHREWDPLREAVVGLPGLRVTLRPSVALAKFGKEYLPEESLAAMRPYARRFLLGGFLRGRDLADFAPSVFTQMKQQLDALVAILERHGVQVHRPSPYTEDELGYLEALDDVSAQVFARDPILVIGSRYIELSLETIGRRRERFALRRALAARVAALGGTLEAMPEPCPGRSARQPPRDAGALLEGGDVLLAGEDVYVGHSGHATNEAGIAWLRASLGPGYRVHAIALDRAYLHLDCVLALLRPGLAMVCRPAFVDGLPAFLKDWELIDVPPADARIRLGCNALVLDPETVVLTSGMPQVAERVARAGQRVTETPLDSVTALGGGLRCLYHPLRRG
jgi:N-dimethylarginine dimethylaminohydrolase